ncbi:uncharacterized protein BP5553_04880 [Venustampulla echinocandica]|uniref:non-specific serine/threonine protein kinase n=1 Tax=Venustampulla echinocandica TaxID=2656787 RepID=A0A370TPJ1_9HELO|nr:uncharacterized protein BP5553_04880 [Venustampulla echinocandica]RDL37447.1 hypothetical protein BP5553_04880 [Venustampulla echinocandica]
MAVSKYICCCFADDSDDDSDFMRPLLDHTGLTPPRSMGPRKRTYGAKKSAFSAAAAAIFGSAVNDPSPAIPSPPRSPLADITSAIGNIALGAGEDEEEESGDNVPQEVEDPAAYLQPLIAAYKADRNRTLEIQKWKDILTEDCSVTKIAEASYAEVYRISTDSGTSIIKVMRLQSPHDVDSLELETAIKIKSVVSEIRIMNALTELPGFVKFKDAHLIQGKSTKLFKHAYGAHERQSKDGSFFPNPLTYTDDSVFLAIELGDAGTVLEEFKLETIDQVWDVLLGVIMALAKGEADFEFEHRDLHENNICVSSTRSPEHKPEHPTLCRFGYSDLEVTIIDYGLSRATLQNGDTVSYDLEEDLTIFEGTDGHPQFNAYRKMRTHLFTSTRGMYPSTWHKPESRNENNGHTWSEHVPYTNVIWIQFILGHLKREFKKKNGASSPELRQFTEETKELSKRLDPRTKVENGAFQTAYEVLEFVLWQGWVTYDQADASGVEFDTLSLSDDEDDSVEDTEVEQEVDDSQGRRGKRMGKRRAAE